VRIDVANGVVVPAAITNDAADELRLEVGMKASAIVMASDVMVGVDRAAPVAHRCPKPWPHAMMRRGATANRGGVRNAAEAAGGTAWEARRSSERPPRQPVR
jgi:hypothetical protein